MEIEVDLSSVPPALTLKDPDDLTAFSVSINHPDDTFVDRETLLQMAGHLADDPAWRAGFDAMLRYAGSQGWIRHSDGAVQAHLTWQA